jgi:hypothetical protein
VYPDILECLEPDLVALYKDEADACDMSIPQYLSQLEFPTGDVQLAYKYRYGEPLIRSEEVQHLPTQMRKLHKWYMAAYKKSQNWIMLVIKDEHYGRENDVINIEFSELF